MVVALVVVALLKRNGKVGTSRVAAAIFLVSLLIAGCSEQAQLKNDLAVDVRLSGCRGELVELRSGATVTLRPHGPCFVRTLSRLEALGCLRFPPEALAEDSQLVVMVSSLDPAISENDCG